MTANNDERTRLIDFLNSNDITAIFHYVPLHKAPYWKGLYDGLELSNTDLVSNTLIRLPLFYGIKDEEIHFITDKVKEFYDKEGN